MRERKGKGPSSKSLITVLFLCEGDTTDDRKETLRFFTGSKVEILKCRAILTTTPISLGFQKCVFKVVGKSGGTFCTQGPFLIGITSWHM